MAGGSTRRQAFSSGTGHPGAKQFRSSQKGACRAVMTDRDLDENLCPSPSRRRPEAAGTDDHGRVLALVASRRAAVQLLGSLSRQGVERVCREVGYSGSNCFDQGTASCRVTSTCGGKPQGVVLDLSRLGTPTNGAIIEPFSGKFRAEWSNAHRFMSLIDEARSAKT